MKEYKKSRTSEEFYVWVAELTQARVNGLFNYIDFLGRKSPIDKKLAEEVLPIYYYLKYKYHHTPFVIKLNPTHEKWDAKIFDENQSFIENLEVTYLPRENQHKDRLILSGKWKDEPPRESFNTDDFLRQMNAIADLEGYTFKIIEKIIKKKKNGYDKNTTLIVSLADEIIMESEKRFESIITTINKKVKDPSPFLAIYITDHTNTLRFELTRHPR